MYLINSVITKLGLRHIGWVEMLIALYPILSNYQYGPIPFSLFTLILIIFIIYRKNKTLHYLKSRDFKKLSLYIIIHEFALVLILGTGTPSYFINNIISLCIIFLSIMVISPYVNWTKLEGSLNWMCIVCLIGMVYQFYLIQSGNLVGILKLPLLPGSGLTRYGELSLRPSSFFQEPAQYSQFMLVPIFLALRKKNYIWAGLVSLSVLMSSSTTGLVLIFVEFAVFMLMGKVSLWSKLLLFIVGGCLIWTLLNNEAFSLATDKLFMESEQLDENTRVTQGPKVVSTMDISDYLFGAPYVSSYHYCLGRNVPRSAYVVYGSGDGGVVYMTSLWLLLLRYGILGLYLYVMVFLKLFKLKDLWPLLICSLIMLYTASFMFSTMYILYIITMFAFVKYVSFSDFKNK